MPSYSKYNCIVVQSGADDITTCLADGRQALIIETAVCDNGIQLIQLTDGFHAGSAKLAGVCQQYTAGCTFQHLATNKVMVGRRSSHTVLQTPAVGCQKGNVSINAVQEGQGRCVTVSLGNGTDQSPRRVDLGG